jgi:hypothetical protein
MSTVQGGTSSSSPSGQSGKRYILAMTSDSCLANVFERDHVILPTLPPFSPRSAVLFQLLDSAGEELTIHYGGGRKDGQWFLRTYGFIPIPTSPELLLASLLRPA